jgi:putative nucleotidyltransferase with HDIG domain
LRGQFTELELLHEVGILCVEQRDENDLIAAFTELIGEHMYSEHFGILILDVEAGALIPHPSLRAPAEVDVFPSIDIGTGVIGRVAATAELLRIQDVRGHPDYRMENPETQSEICVPLIAGDRLLGVINAESSQQGAFSEADERLLTTLAAQLGVAIANLRLYQETERRNLEISALYETAIATNSLVDVSVLLDNLGTQVQKLLSPDTFIVILFDQEQDDFEMAYILDHNQRLTEFEGRRIPLAEGGLTSWVIQQGKSLFVQDILTDPLPVKPMHVQRPSRSWIGVPMLVRSELSGVLLVQSYDPYQFQQEDLRFLESVAGQFATSLNNARLYAAARRQASQLAVVNDLAREMALHVDLDRLCSTVVEHLLDAFDYLHVVVLLLNTDNGQLTPRAAAGRLAQSRPIESLPSMQIGEGIIGQAALTQRPVLVNDTRLSKDFIALHDVQIRSELAVPLKSGDELIGVLNIDSARLDGFDSSDVVVLSTLADQLATAIGKARLIEETQQRAASLERQIAETHQRVEELSLLFDVSRDFSSAPPNYDAITKSIARRFIAFSGAEACSISLLEPDQETMIVIASYLSAEGSAPGEVNEWLGHMYKLSDFPGRAAYLESNLAMQIRRDDPDADLQELSYMENHDVAVQLILPMISRDRTIGSIELETKNPDIEFLPERLTVMTTLANQAAITLDNARLYEELEASFVETVVGLAKAIDARDTYTGDHSKRLADLGVRLSERLAMNPKDVQAVRWASLLHDIGKIGVPDEILRKPGPLNEEEWALMRRHPALGAEIIAPFHQLSSVIPLIRAHQEKFDGTGYPEGLAGEEIPLGARILAVVDTYGAITDERVYRSARSHTDAINEIRDCSGSHFDPRVVQAFLEIIKEEDNQSSTFRSTSFSISMASPNE